MQTHTVQIIDATLRADSTVTSGKRRKILKLACGEEDQSTAAQNGEAQPPRIYSRVEAAKLVGDKTPRYVDMLAKRGLLKKFIPKGNVRAIGICGESLRAFVEGN